MNKKILNNNIDIMLKNYCSRKAQIAFDLDLQNSNPMKTKKGFFAVAVSVMAIILVFSLVLVQVINIDNTTNVNDTSVMPKGFVISASAAEREPVMLQNVEVELCPKDEKGLFADSVCTNGDVAIEPIWFNMSGENVETFDYKCTNGMMYYVIPELKDKMELSNGKIKQDDYFKKGKKLTDIPYDSSNPEYVFVSWYSDKIDKEGMEYLSKAGYRQPYGQELVDYRNEHLKTEEDFNRYFGDTITITAHYKDGTSETAVIEVSLDIREESGIIYGNYVLKYA